MSVGSRSPLKWDGRRATFTARGKRYQWRLVPARHGQRGFYVELWRKDKRVGLVQQYPATMGEQLNPEAIGRGDPAWPDIKWARRAAEEKTWDMRHPTKSHLGDLALLAIQRRRSS